MSEKTSKRIDFGIMYGLNMNSGHDYPDGVYAELLEGYRDQDVVNKTAPDLKTYFEGKKAWDLYISTMTALQADKGFWGYKEKQVAETLKKHYDEFKKLGVNTFYCSELVGAGTKQFKTFKWVVYVDADIAPNYVPERVFGEGKCCVM
jgi:hypothetical protein